MKIIVHAVRDGKPHLPKKWACLPQLRLPREATLEHGSSFRSVAQPQALCTVHSDMSRPSSSPATVISCMPVSGITKNNSLNSLDP